MDTIPHAGPFPVPDSRPRCLRWPLMRILIAIVFVMLPFVLLQIILHKLPIAKSLRQVWPALLSSGCCYAMYGMYVRLIERRPMLEFARAGAWREAACGALIGMLLFCLVIAALYVSGAYRITGSNGWSVMVAPFFGMIVAGFLEEILFRGIVLRILQNWLGSWAALLISVLVFALAHVTNDSVTAIALASVAAAGLLLSAAYMLTQRLWLGIGIHAAWNFTQGGLFSASVSGNSSHGMIEGVFSGPAWLSGGDFGVEGSVLALFFVLGAGILMLTRVNKNHIVPAPWRRRPGSLPA